MRPDGRQPDELRPISFERDFTTQTAGSVLVTAGNTMVLCTATIDDDVPRWMRGSGKGWVTAEYSMLPGSSNERIRREVSKGSPGGRTHEIQRLIGRSFRAVCDMVVLGERQVIVDCDVLQADGGTRTASINGGYLALHDALTRHVQRGAIAEHPLTEACAAVSVGIVGGVPILDLPYVEDSNAEVDMNVVMTQSGRFIEVQGTAEGMAFSRDELDELLRLAEVGVNQIVDLGAQLLAEPPRPAPADVTTPSEGDPRPTLVVASANPDKVAEIAAVLGDSVVLRPRPVEVGEVVEDADTLVGNARLKAVAIASATGQAAVADDTGLEVAALDGAPGVYSARYSGEGASYADNVTKLLEELDRVGARGTEARAARFRTVALVHWPDGRELAVEGEVRGSIAESRRGDRGFGYDPVFVPDELDGSRGHRTFAQMTAEEKHAVSHRGRAFRALALALSDLDPT